MANRNFRVGELEIKPNYTSIVRGYNFDSRYYVNDKNSPAEDEPASGSYPAQVETGWSQRFFFLPTRLCSQLATIVGTTSRVNQHPYGGLGSGFVNGVFGFPPVGDPGITPPYSITRNWYDIQNVNTMVSYGVTIDPARVPLTSTRISAPVLWNPNDTYPRQPRYSMWNGSWVSSVYLEDSTSKPDTLIDGTGPFTGSMGMRPAFFSVYETVGIRNIGANDFIQTGAGYPPPVPRAMWFKTRAEIGTSVFNTGGSPAFYKYMGGSGIAPFFAYVLRPSTRAIVGWLYSMYNLGGYGPASTGYGGGTNINNNTGVLPGPAVNHPLGAAYTYDSRWAVSGIQDGDLIVWEWWCQASCGSGGGQHYELMGAGPWITNDSVEFGGGLPGQPLTFDGGNSQPWGSIPDWAASQGCPLQYFSGFGAR